MKKQNDSRDMIGRRDFLKKLSLMMGGSAASIALGASSINLALAYTPKSGSEKRAGLLFSQAQMMTLKHVVDIILPATDSPSASQLDCHGFIDQQLKICYPEEEQASFVSCIDFIDGFSAKFNKTHFYELTAQQQLSMLNDIENDPLINLDKKGEFARLKALVAFAYFTSEVGASKVLQYQAVPGGFKGSIKIDHHTPSYGSRDYY